VQIPDEVVLAGLVFLLARFLAGQRFHGAVGAGGDVRCTGLRKASEGIGDAGLDLLSELPRS
jgi:hypothetical protein